MSNKIQPLPSTKEKIGHITIDGHKRRFKVLNEVRRQQSNYPNKIILLQQIQFENDKRIEYRLGYYIIGKKGKRKDKWVWGQFATMLPKKDLNDIISKAIEKSWVKIN